MIGCSLEFSAPSHTSANYTSHLIYMTKDALSYKPIIILFGHLGSFVFYFSTNLRLSISLFIAEYSKNPIMSDFCYNCQ